MKKMIYLAALLLGSAASSAVYATAACAGGAGASVNVTGATTNYVKRDFSAKCSTNVLSNYSQTNTSFGVVAGSQKGKSYFGGGTNGGGIKRINDCAATGCTTGAEINDTNSATARDSTS